MLLKCFRRHLKDYRRNAAIKDVPWDLSEDGFRALTSLRCHYCGAEPMRMTLIIRGERRLSQEKFNGIDRVDSNLGYTVANCVPCCRNCNWAKRTLSEAEFIAHCEKIINYWKTK